MAGEVTNPDSWCPRLPYSHHLKHRDLLFVVKCSVYRRVFSLSAFFASSLHRFVRTGLHPVCPGDRRKASCILSDREQLQGAGGAAKQAGHQCPWGWEAQHCQAGLSGDLASMLGNVCQMSCLSSAVCALCKEL